MRVHPKGKIGRFDMDLNLVNSSTASSEAPRLATRQLDNLLRLRRSHATLMTSA